MSPRFGISCTQTEAREFGVFIATCKSSTQAERENREYEKVARHAKRKGLVKHFYEPSKGYHFYWFPRMASKERNTMNINQEPHEPASNCHIIHCYSHGIDESDNSGHAAYHRCFECTHLFQTEQDLVDAYNEMLYRISPLLSPVVIGKDINSCPYCAHDF